MTTNKVKPKAPASLGRRIPVRVVIGGALILVYVAAALAPGIFSPFDPLTQDLAHRLAAPDPAHWLGTDALGRDVLSRLIHSTQVDLRVAVLATVFSLLLGTFLGAVAGYFGGFLDAIIMRTADLILSFPVLVLFLAFVSVLGPGEGWWILGKGEPPVILVAGIVGWVVYARLVRSEILRIRTLDYVSAARAGGLSEWRILVRHVMPNAVNQTIVYAVVDVGLVVLALASLSFLGLGIPLPIPEWGSMIAEGKPYLVTQWWLVVVPGLAIAALGIGLALVGDGLDDRIKNS